MFIGLTFLNNDGNRSQKIHLGKTMETKEIGMNKKAKATVYMNKEDKT